MVDWRDYQKQSKTDFDACRLLYSVGDYGNAAYHLQQSVEKHAKAILYSSNSIPVPWTHMPLDFVAELLLAFEKIEKLEKKYKVLLEHTVLDEERIKYLHQCKDLMAELTKGSRKVTVKHALEKFTRDQSRP